MTEEIHVCLNHTIDEDGTPGFSLKILSQTWEINVYLTKPELLLIPQARTARWDDWGSLKIGKSAGDSAFWCCSEGLLSILVGHDQETWDFCVAMPATVIDDIMAEIERESDIRF